MTKHSLGLQVLLTASGEVSRKRHSCESSLTAVWGNLNHLHRTWQALPRHWQRRRFWPRGVCGGAAEVKLPPRMGRRLAPMSDSDCEILPDPASLPF